MLELANVRAGYGQVEVLHGVSLSVGPGQIVSLLGSNGAGKSTTLGAIAGTVVVRDGAVTFEGVDLLRKRADQRAALGVGLVPEGRKLFPTLSVEDNLLLGAFHLRRRKQEVRGLLAEMYDRFPLLGERRSAEARTLSGGEAQLLAVGRALMGRPKLIVLDEPSLGLAPRMVGSVFAALTTLSESGVAVLLAEQNAVVALDHSERGYVLERGSVVMDADAGELRANPEVAASYLGGAS